MEMRVNEIQASMEKIIADNIQQLELKELLLSFVVGGGKENYPFGELCIFHYQHFSSSFDNEIYEVAAAIELLVLSFDILDDLEDNDTNDKPWSNNTPPSLNASTALLFLSMNAIRKTHFTYKEKALSFMERNALRSIEGQHKDLLSTCQDEKTYIEMMEEKSGSLVMLACLVGCIIANGDGSQEAENYSKWMGVIGQINNDISDLKKWDKKNDMLNKKYSLPIIYLLDIERHSEQIVTKYYQNEMSKEQLLAYKHIIQRKLIDTDAIKYALVIKSIFQQKVKQEFAKMNFSGNQMIFLQKYTK